MLKRSKRETSDNDAKIGFRFLSSDEQGMIEFFDELSFPRQISETSQIGSIWNGIRKKKKG